MKLSHPCPFRVLFTFFAIFNIVTLFSNNAWAIAGVDFPLEEDLEFSEVQQMIDDGKYDEAVSYLNSEVLEWYPENAEALTLKGYSLRGLNQNNESMDAYNAALVSNPEHKGALEYQGELYLKLGNQKNAQSNLEKLESICPNGCDAFYTLQTAIEKFKDGSITWTPPEKS